MFMILKAHRGSDLVQVIWRDGTLSGDQETVAEMQRMAAAYEGNVITSLVDSSTHDHLSNPATVATLMAMVCTDYPVTVETDVPPIPEPPEGAVM